MTARPVRLYTTDSGVLLEFWGAYGSPEGARRSLARTAREAREKRQEWMLGVFVLVAPGEPPVLFARDRQRAEQAAAAVRWTRADAVVEDWPS